MSFHWGWFLRYKLSQPQHRHPSWARRPSSRTPKPRHRARHLSPPALLHHAVRPQTPARHTAYPLSPTDSGGSGRLSVCYGVSRASYIFSGCIILLPHSPSVPRHISPRSSRSTSIRTALVIYCPGIPKGSRHAGRRRNFLRSLAKLELRSSFRDRLMFRRFIKTEKRRGSRGRPAGRPVALPTSALLFVVQPIGFRNSYLLARLIPDFAFRTWLAGNRYVGM